MQEMLLINGFYMQLFFFLRWLMVSTLPLMALKFKDYTVKNNLPKIILLA